MTIWSEPRFLPCGDRALSVELGDEITRDVNARVLALEYLIQQKRLLGVAETVPSYRALLVYYDPLVVGYEELIATLRVLLAEARPEVLPPVRTVELLEDLRALYSGHTAAMNRDIRFAGVVLILAGGAKLAVKLGWVDDTDLSRRVGMVTVGLVLAYIGNSIPKTLTPLSTLQCDGARTQAFQRWSGWIWVLAGLGYGLVWLVAPIEVASPISMAVVVAAMIAVVSMLIRLRRRSHRVFWAI